VLPVLFIGSGTEADLVIQRLDILRDDQYRITGRDEI
jgi:hypothetical protein